MDIVDMMMDHAAEKPNEEVCGLVVSGLKKAYVIRGSNIAHDRRVHFDLDPEVWLRVPTGHQVVASYHSHPDGIVEPSMADKIACEASQMPMYIVCASNKAQLSVQPSGYKAPYTGRLYVHGVTDCYAVVRDWYNREWQLGLPDFERQWEWWWKGENLYLDNFKACGFELVNGMPVKHGDAFLIQVASDVPNHAAVWLEGGKILHHVQDRVSSITPWTGYWAQNATHHLRHKSRM